MLAPDASTRELILANRIYQPPSRNALDFLGAPQRLSGFPQGRALKVLTAPHRRGRQDGGTRRRCATCAHSLGATLSTYAASPQLDDQHPIVVPQLDQDVSDVDGLVAVQRFLFATPRHRSALLAKRAF